MLLLLPTLLGSSASRSLCDSITEPGVTSSCVVRLPEPEVPLQFSSQSLVSSKITAIALAPRRAALWSLSPNRQE